MSVFMIFNGDLRDQSHPYGLLHSSIQESFKRYHSANALDAYSFQPNWPVVSELSNTNLLTELSKRQSYCLIQCQPSDVDIILVLNSSNLEEPFMIKVDNIKALTTDPVQKLIACHTNGTISTEMLECQYAFPAQERDLTEEEAELLLQARDEVNFAKAKSLVNKVFLDKEFKGKQQIKSFCAKHLKRFEKSRELS